MAVLAASEAPQTGGGANWAAQTFGVPPQTQLRSFSSPVRLQGCSASPIVPADIPSIARPTDAYDQFLQLPFSDETPSFLQQPLQSGVLPQDGAAMQFSRPSGSGEGVARGFPSLLRPARFGHDEASKQQLAPDPYERQQAGFVQRPDRILAEPAFERSAVRSRSGSPVPRGGSSGPLPRGGLDNAAGQQGASSEVLSQIATALTSLAAAQTAAASKQAAAEAPAAVAPPPAPVQPNLVGPAWSSPAPAAACRQAPVNVPLSPRSAQCAQAVGAMRPGSAVGNAATTQHLLDWQKEIRDMVLSVVATPQGQTGAGLPVVAGPCRPSAGSQCATPSAGPVPGAARDKAPMHSKSVQVENAASDAGSPRQFSEDGRPDRMDERAMIALRRDFNSKVQGLKSLLQTELEPRRQDLLSAVEEIDRHRALVRQRCAEAEREAREEFDGLRGHLASVESLKQAVLGRERDVRCSIVDAIEDLAQQVQGAQRAGLSANSMASFVRSFPDLQAAADSLWSRSASLPQVEVSADDIPFEARARAEKLRQLAVVQEVLLAKDAAMWRLEQQRRQSASEAHEASSWMRQLEVVLERYTEELSYVCYFCAERFSAAAANTRCAYNVYSGHGPPADSRVPPSLWGTGLHFWVPQGLLPSDSVPASSSRPCYQATAGFGSRGLQSSAQVEGAVPAVHARGLDRLGGRPVQRLYGGQADSRFRQQWLDAQLARILKACEEQMMDVKTAFRIFDTDGDGLLSPTEFLQALANLRLGLSDDDAWKLIASLDKNEDGRISYEEFLTGLFSSAADPSAAHVGPALVEHFASQDAAARSLWKRVSRSFLERGVPLRQVFALFDSDGDGVISRQELEEAFRMMHLGLAAEDVDRLLNDLDVNKDGKINVREFIARLQ